MQSVPTPPTRLVQSGQHHATREPAQLITVLGSCVATCLYDPVAGVAGMNHFLLPGSAPKPQPGMMPGHYGATATQSLIDAMLAQGAKRHRLEAHVFGGAGVLAGLSDSQRVGQRNADFILAYLAEAGIPLHQQDLGGKQARMLRFNSQDGSASVRYIEAQNQALALPDHSALGGPAATHRLDPLTGSGR